MARSKYSLEQRSEAVGLAASVGQTKAAEATGIPKQTIDWWMRNEFKHLVDAARDTVAERFWLAVQVGLGSVVEGFDSQAPLKDKAYALGVVYDRYALLTGGATTRSENRDITGTLSDSELVAALREAERLAAGERTPAEAPGSPEGEGV